MFLLFSLAVIIGNVEYTTEIKICICTTIGYGWVLQLVGRKLWIRISTNINRVG